MSLGRHTLKRLIVLFAAVPFLAQAENDPNNEDSYQMAAASAADSLVQSYSNAPSETAKLQAALPLWVLFRHRPRIDVQQINALKELDRRALNKFILTSVEKPNHQSFLIDFGLLQSKDSIQPFFERYEDLDTTNFNNRQKAAWYYQFGRNIYSFNRALGNHEQYFKRSYKYAKGDDDLQWLQYVNLGHLGSQAFDRKQLDSAIALFSEQRNVYDQIKKGRLVYVKGFGFYYKNVPTNGRVLMNLGMCYEKKGNLIQAKDYYEQAITTYHLVGNNGGQYWGKAQLINTFLDLGNTPRAEYLLRELSEHLKQNYTGTSTLYALDYYLLPALFEFDLNDLKNSGALVDSVLSIAELRAGPPSEHHKKGVYRQPYFLNRAWSLSLHMLIEKETFSKGAPINFLDSFQHLMACNDTAQFHFNSIKVQVKNALECIALAWHIALSQSGNNVAEFERLKNLLANRAEMGYHNYQFQLTTWILHSAGKFQQELDLLTLRLAELNEGGFVIDRRKAYLQMSQAYEGKGNRGKAFEYYKLYDSLRAQTQQMNQHAQLSALDKKLELARVEQSRADLEVENQALAAKKTVFRNFLIAASVVLVMAILLIRNIRKRHLAERGRKAAEMSLLKQTVTDKESALDNITLELLGSNNSYAKLIEDIEALTTNLSPENRKKARSVLVDYKSKSQNQIWQEFNLEFNRINAGFFEKLKAKVPDLTKTELRVCAMHLSGLSNQEIVSITGQQLGSLYTLKSRLRKKMGVESEEEFRAFLKNA